MFDALLWNSTWFQVAEQWARWSQLPVPVCEEFPKIYQLRGGTWGHPLAWQVGFRIGYLCYWLVCGLRAVQCVQWTAELLKIPGMTGWLHPHSQLKRLEESCEITSDAVIWGHINTTFGLMDNIMFCHISCFFYFVGSYVVEFCLKYIHFLKFSNILLEVYKYLFQIAAFIP